MNKFLEFLKTKGHTAETFKALEVEKQADIQNEYLGSLEMAIGEMSTKTEVADALKKSNETLKDFLTSEIEGKIAEMKNAPEFKELKSLVKENFEEIKTAIKEKKSLDIFTVKAPAIHRTDNDVMTYDVTVDFEVGDNVITDSTIVGIRYPENFILNFISNRLVSKVPTQYRRIEQLDKEGLLTITAEGVLKPLVDYSFVMTATDREKAACRIEWSEEFAYDWEALYREIVRMLERDAVREWQELVLNTILTEGTPYVASALDGTLSNPDNGHAVIAAQSQLEALNYMANLVLMNPADWTALKVQQDNEGRPLVLPYVGANDINGINVVRSNFIPQGTCYVMDSTIFDEIHGGFVFRTGQYNDQLIHNLYTLIAEVFFIVNIAQRDVIGIVEVDLAVVKSVLQTV